MSALHEEDYTNPEHSAVLSPEATEARLAILKQQFDTVSDAELYAYIRAEALHNAGWDKLIGSIVNRVAV